VPRNTDPNEPSPILLPFLILVKDMSILGASSSSWSTEPSRNARVTTHTFVVFSFPRLRGETTNAFDLDDDDAEKEEPLRAENAFAKTTNDGVDAKIILFAFLLLRATTTHEYYSYTYTQNFEEHKNALLFCVVWNEKIKRRTEKSTKKRH
tara:strand:- start:715 stop:1167 length:453 start_codon:yes stop_codon:yes gene_type:complete